LIWSPGDVLRCIDMFCFEGVVTTFNTITLKAIIYDVNGCSATDEMIISIDKSRKIYIPNAFSPNDNSSNDRFYIFGSERQVRKIKSFAIYNRWGDVLHEAFDFLPNDPSKGWDGTFKNEMQNPGVFVYRAEIEYMDGVIEVRTGDVTLVR